MIEEEQKLRQGIMDSYLVILLEQEHLNQRKTCVEKGERVTLGDLGLAHQQRDYLNELYGSLHEYNANYKNNSMISLEQHRKKDLQDIENLILHWRELYSKQLERCA